MTRNGEGDGSRATLAVARKLVARPVERRQSSSCRRESSSRPRRRKTLLRREEQKDPMPSAVRVPQITGRAKEATPEGSLRVVSGLAVEHKTQSSVRTLTGLRPQMDVRFCATQEHQPREHRCAAARILFQTNRALSRAHTGISCFLVDKRLTWRPVIRSPRDKMECAARTKLP